MYFTVLSYDTAHMVKCLNDRDMMHKFIQSLFDKQRAEANTIHYVSVDNEEIIITSDVPPVIKGDSVKVVFSEEVDFSNWIVNGTATLEIHAFPCVTRSTMESKNGKRYYLHKDNDKYDWLNDKLTKGGCSNIKVMEIFNRSEKIDICKGKPNQRMCNIDSFVVNVKVDDIEKFIKMCSCGIGTNKSYGCGMVIPFKWY